jgi:hypothetical protein
VSLRQLRAETPAAAQLGRSSRMSHGILGVDFDSSKDDVRSRLSQQSWNRIVIQSDQTSSHHEAVIPLPATNICNPTRGILTYKEASNLFSKRAP